MGKLSAVDMERLLEEALSKKAVLEAELRKKQALAASQSFEEFMKFTMFDTITGRPFIVEDIHHEWVKHLERFFPLPDSKVGILAPFGSGKSSWLSIGLPLFLFGHNQRLRIGLCSNKDSNSSDRLNAVGTHITTNDRYQEVFPHVIPDPKGRWNEHSLRLLRPLISSNDSMEAWGIDSSVTGNRYDILLVDDPCDINDASSVAKKIGRVDQFIGAFMPRLDRGGRVGYIATCWAVEDITWQLVRNPDWKFLVQGVSDDLSCIEQPPSAYMGLPGVIVPERRQIPIPPMIPIEKLKTYKRMSPRAFARGYQQMPFSEEDMTFTPLAIKKATRWDLHRDDIAAEAKHTWVGVDPAGKSRPGTVIFTFAMLADKRKYVLDIRKGNWGPTRAMVEQILDVNRRYTPSRITIENNALQSAVLSLVREVTPYPLPLYGHNTGREKTDLDLGLPGLADELDAGDWIFPFAHVKHHRGEGCTCGYCTFLTEIEQYPNGVSTDCVMAWFLANIGMRKRGASGATPLTGSGGGGSREFGMQSREFASQSRMF